MKLIDSGKVTSSFHIARAMALGGDMTNSARAMMIGIGCILALLCNINRCPTWDRYPGSRIDDRSGCR